MFGYKCHECKKGIVEEQVFRSYETKFKHEHFVVRNAKIGVCSYCGAENFSSKEYRRWKELWRQRKRN